MANGILYTRTGNESSHEWSTWKTYSFDIPSFYKNYSDLASLASALGVHFGLSIMNVTLAADETIQLTTLQQGMILMQYSDLMACYSYHRGDRSFIKLYGTASFESMFEPQLDSNGSIQIHNKFSYSLYLTVRIYN